MAKIKKSAAEKPIQKADPSKEKKPSASDEVDQQLARYRSMRDFKVTAEPGGGTGTAKQTAAGSLPFVVQKHAATRLHYDFRLGWHGVLKSWAVTKGPSFVTADKRLAVQVEDHPMEYGGFEGTIPKGQYGGGTVMLWDQGTWEPQAGVDVDASLKAGNLKFILHGQKLQGKWALIRMGGKAAQESKPNWLLIKEHDDYERSSKDPQITEQEPNSVLTQRDLEAIGQQQDHVWQSKPAHGAERKMSAEARLRARLQQKTGRPSAAPPAPRPNVEAHRHMRASRGSSKKSGAAPAADFISPELAVQATSPPTGDVWLHEIKYDGYRIQAICDDTGVRLVTRSGLDWTHRMPSIATALAKLELAGSTLDGEVVVLNEQGQTDFAALQGAFDNAGTSPLLYYVFDAMRAEREDIRSLPLLQRKERLKKMLTGAPPGVVRFSEHAVGTGRAMFEEACRLGAEGIVSKRGDAPYRSGRQPDWIKVKCYRRQELVIAGFTLPTHNDRGIGSLLLGYYKDGELIYAGRTGTGFTAASGQKLRQRLDKLKSDAMPFQQISTAARKGALWVKPELVCEVSFATWTAEGSVRQASFQGLREDKPASEVHREEAVPVKNLTADAQLTPRTVTARFSVTSTRKAQQGIRLTHPDKILDAATKLTKQQLADYLTAVRAVMLPHVVSRPSSLLRCPEGAGHPCFYQKHTSKGMPEGLAAVQIPDRKGGPAEEYVTIESAAGLVGTAQMGALEIHPWGSSNASLEKPDRLIFDLDPDPALPWKVVIGAANQVRELLHKYDLVSFVKLSGGKGLHIVAPILPQHEWPAIKIFCRRVAEEIEASNTGLYLIKMTKAARVNRIFIDYFRNERGATAIAPWCARAREGMPVAVPLSWKELNESASMPQFRVADFARWQQRVALDPWKKMLTTKQCLASDYLEPATEHANRTTIRRADVHPRQVQASVR